MTSPDQTPIVDRAVIRRLEALAPPAESQKFVNELVGIFLGLAPQVLTDLADAFARQDANAVACHAHRLKSVSLNLGAVQLGHLCEQVEASAKADPALVSPAVVAQLRQAYTAAARELQNLFAGSLENQ